MEERERRNRGKRRKNDRAEERERKGTEAESTSLWKGGATVLGSPSLYPPTVMGLGTRSQWKRARETIRDGTRSLPFAYPFEAAPPDDDGIMSTSTCQTDQWRSGEPSVMECCRLLPPPF